MNIHVKCFPKRNSGPLAFFLGRGSREVSQINLKARILHYRNVNYIKNYKGVFALNGLSHKRYFYRICNTFLLDDLSNIIDILVSKIHLDILLLLISIEIFGANKIFRTDDEPLAL